MATQPKQAKRVYGGGEPGTGLPGVKNSHGGGSSQGQLGMIGRQILGFMDGNNFWAVANMLILASCPGRHRAAGVPLILIY